MHGPFRAAARALHTKVLAELNTPVRLGKWDTGEGKEEKEEALMLLAGETGEVEEEALMGLATCLVWSAHSMCKLITYIIALRTMSLHLHPLAFSFCSDYLY